MRRRNFLKLAPLLPLCGCVQFRPVRAAKPEPYFPSLAHQFVWRNWDLVKVDLIARALTCDVATVNDLSLSMGLGAQKLVDAPLARMWFKILRRNWDFVPFHQIAILLRQSEAEIRTRMIPFNFVGNHLGPKPECPPIRIEHSTIRSTAFEHFKFPATGEEEARFAFLDQLAIQGDTRPQKGNVAVAGLSPRIVFPYSATYDGLNEATWESYYSSQVLNNIRGMGADSIWLHALLRDLVPSKIFPNLGTRSNDQRKKLQKIIKDSAECGLGVYLVLNEPRGMPAQFYERNSALRGARGRPTDLLTSMCTSTAAVRAYLEESAHELFESVPELEGVILLTASEAPTHCYSVHWWTPCPRCARRTRPSVIGDVVGLIEKGVHRSKPSARVIVWDWSWSAVEADPQQKIIDHLPKSVTLMVDFERGLPIDRQGIASKVDEYSLSVVGPSPRAMAHIRHAQARNMEVMAKIQVGTTWELGPIPYLPVPSLVAEKFHALRAAGVTGAMMSWTLGTCPSPNWEVARAFSAEPLPELDTVLRQTASRIYGEEAVPQVVRAWLLFAEAFQQYPFANPVVYSSVVQHGPAHPMYWLPTGKSPRAMNNYDDLRWTQPFGPQKLSQMFLEMANAWKQGLDVLKDALLRVPPEKQHAAVKDYNISRVVYLYWKSISNQIQFCMLRERSGVIPKLRDLVVEEVDLAEELYSLVIADSRIGFEPSMQYLYLPHDILERIASCRYMLANQLN